VLNTEWTIVATLLVLPILVLGLFEAVGYSNRRRERARAHRSKRR
jgi:hypothetical protein